MTQSGTCGGVGAPIRGCPCSFCQMTRPPVAREPPPEIKLALELARKIHAR